MEALLLKAVSLRLLSRTMKWQHLACLSLSFGVENGKIVSITAYMDQ